MIQNVIAENKKSGIRLDAALLMLFPTSSRSFIRQAISNGSILVNSRKAFKGLKLKGSEILEIKELLEENDNTIAPNNSIEVNNIYTDEQLLAFDKPSGMKVQPLSCTETDTLMNGVVSRWPECASSGDLPLMGGALHRIDTGTSGLVLIARDKTTYENIRQQFSQHTVKKTYLALVEGKVEGSGVIETDLVHDDSCRFCRMVDIRKARCPRDEKPMHAITSYKPIFTTKTECEDRTLLEVTIKTGVTHQIRAQLASLSMHIINDTLYGAFAVEGIKGHFLHSLNATFVHPSTGVETTISTALPNWARSNWAY